MKKTAAVTTRLGAAAVSSTGTAEAEEVAPEAALRLFHAKYVFEIKREELK